MSLTPEEFERSINELQSEMVPMLGRYLDIARNRLAATATGEYMQDRGLTSPPFPPRRSRSGPLRRLSGRLSRSLTGGRSFTGGGNANNENISEISSTKEGVKLRYGTNVPYAHVHEEGFIGQVSVESHQRTIVQAFGKPLSSKKTVNVAAHTRFMTIPARPYLNPSLEDNRAWLSSKLADESQDMILEVFDG